MSEEEDTDVVRRLWQAYRPPFGEGSFRRATLLSHVSSFAPVRYHLRFEKGDWITMLRSDKRYEGDVEFLRKNREEKFRVSIRPVRPLPSRNGCILSN